MDGVLLLHKKLDFTPVNLCVYPIPPLQPTRSHALVASHTGSLMVYQGTRLMWAAKAESVPIVMKVIKIDDLEGAIITLTDAGHLSVNYLGTRPNQKLLLPTEVWHLPSILLQMDDDVQDIHVDGAQLNAEYKALKSALQKNQTWLQSQADAVDINMSVTFLDRPTELPFGHRSGSESTD